MTSFSKERTLTYVGIAAADKAEDSRELWVYCQELLPFVSGELNAREYETEISTSSPDSGYSGNIKTSNCILCQYRSMESNRMLPPDVRRGEQVIVTCFSDTNIFYWDTAGVDTGTRRTETYRIGVGDTAEYNAALGDDNTYYLELDTRRHKHVKISTSLTDEEKYRYMLLISPELSKIILTDNINNSICIDSEKHYVTLTNNDGSILSLEAENILMACKGNITIDAKEGEIMMHSGKNTTFKTDENFIHDILKTSTVTANESMQYITHKDYTCNADTTFSAHAGNDMTVVTDASLSVSASSGITVTSSADYTASSSGKMSFSANGAYSVSSSSSVTISAGSSAAITSSSGMSLSAGGGLSMSFKGSGTCESSGGSMTMRMARLSIMKG